MTRTTRDVAMAQDINEVVSAAWHRVVGREPRTTGWNTPAGWWIGWSTEAMGHDPGAPRRWAAFKYRPTGPGSQGDVAAQERRLATTGVTMVLVAESYRATRKSARRQALRWYVARLRQESTMRRLPPRARARAARDLARWEHVTW